MPTIRIVEFRPLIAIIFLFFFTAVPARAQNTEKTDFFIAPLAEILGYSRQGPSFGGGVAVGAGNGVAIGARFLYAVDTESVNTVELAVFMRFYPGGADACTGLFVQLNAGAFVLGLHEIPFAFAKSGSISAGIAAGWRFPLGERWYMEPSVRVGYPYMLGAGVAFAFRL